MANKLLKERLALAGYFEVSHTPGLWRHVRRSVAFSLAVHDFGAKYVSRKNAEHLATAIKKFYPLSEDWTGSLYLGGNLEWNYNERWMDCSMKNYVLKGLQKFCHSPPDKLQHSPFPVPPRKFGAAAQAPDPPNKSPLLDEEGKLDVQRVIGTFYITHGRSTEPSSPASPP